MSNGVAYIGVGAFAAFVSAFSFSQLFLAYRRRNRVRLAARVLTVSGDEKSQTPQTLDDRLLRYAETVSRKIALGVRKAPRQFMRSAQACVDAHAAQAGVKDVITPQGLCAARRDISLGAAGFGLLVGWVFSGELAAALCAVGLICGWRVLPRAIVRRKAARADELERGLPDMLETVAMGLRSGMSFDRSLALYANHFDTLLATSCKQAYNRCSSGISTREEALRALAATYDSGAFERVVETMLRSLRFGSALAESLEESAAQARAEYRARKQEQVAKAPIKMMVPTSTLMLPAMLLLVLGPVLLELMAGF